MKKPIIIFISILYLLLYTACEKNTNSSSKNQVISETTVATTQLNATDEPSKWLNKADILKITDYSETIYKDNLYDVSVVIAETYSINASYTMENIYKHITLLLSSLQGCKSVNSLSVSFLNGDNPSDVLMNFKISGDKLEKIDPERISPNNYILQKQADELFIRKINISDNSFYPADFLSDYDDIDDYIAEQLTIYFSEHFENVQVNKNKKNASFYVKAYVPQTKNELISDWNKFLETSSHSYKAYNSIITELSKYNLDFTVYSTDDILLYNTVVDEKGKEFTYDVNKKTATSFTDTSSDITVYITKTGKKYHYNSNCNGGSYSATTLESAKSNGYTKCSKCG